MELFQYKLSACCILVFGRQLSFEVDHQSTYHNCPLFWCISEFCSCLLVIHEADDVCSIKNSWDKTLSWNRHCSEKLCQYGWDLINNVTLPFWHPSSSLFKGRRLTSVLNCCFFNLLQTGCKHWQDGKEWVLIMCSDCNVKWFYKESVKSGFRLKYH